ncbi:solute carrier family 22 member 16-like [Aplysia californica]|uniref:Solute carrier family 22 member 16-like n=1 Tax=Aplysia californica TaxID=6500 RepID=A0ABM0K5S9_APLCA|nr:solute carrier family 22 member 16-like [Aplysia californica]
MQEYFCFELTRCDVMADQRALHVDNVLLALGATGKYQIIQMVVSISPTLAAAIQLLSNVFTCRQVPHQCAPPPNGSAFYSKFQDLDNVTYTYETCSIVVRSNGSLVAEENCLFGMHYDLPVDASAVSQFDLVCDRASLAKLSQTLVICGQGIGAVLTTIASDRLGRKGILTGTFTFNAELFPIKARRLNAVFCGLIWAFGVMLLSPVSYLCSDLGWRTTQAVYCSASLTLLLQIGFMDESLRWLLANGKSHRAVKVIQRAARTNGKRYEDVMSAYAGVQESKEMAPAVDEHVLEKSTKKMTLLDLLRVRRLLVNALAIWFAWFTTALGFFAIYLTSTSLSGNRFLNFFLTACMEIPSNIFFYFSLNSGFFTAGVCAVAVVRGFAVARRIPEFKSRPRKTFKFPSSISGFSAAMQPRIISSSSNARPVTDIGGCGCLFIPFLGGPKK